MRHILRLALPLARRSYSSSSNIPYKTEATHSGVNLAETTPSHRMDQTMVLTDTSVPHLVFNEKRIRLRLQELEGGSVDLVKDNETGIARVVINNPSKGNAMTGSMMVDLADIIKELEKWRRGKGLILHGNFEGSHFCSGGDVAVLRGLNQPEDGGMMCLYMQNTLGRLQRLPLITMAMVSGQAIGGGAELTTACDFRVMTDDSQIMFKQAQLGLSTGWGGGTRLVRLVGPQKALQLLAGSQSVSAAEAVQMGLAEDILPRGGDVLESATNWLGQYTRASVDLVQGMKNLVLAAGALPQDKALKAEREIFRGLWFAPEHRAKLAKLLETLQKEN
ncbi:ethylmalonyl-CoA decarboxylase-like [Diadema antillarum]|uniref:ethylmalonyl-CoA decarboxylase-like n=1 Tax=Diadema antillarum TaxID=105358 RepID=UPI003A88BD77